jgi:hypothetical protein
MGAIDPANSYLFPLDSADSFSGAYTSNINFNEILISVETDTTFSLTVNFSSNGTDFGLERNFEVTVPSSTAFTYSIKPYLRYYQITLTNTSLSNQTYLRLETIQKSNGVNVGRGNINSYIIFDGSTGAGGVSQVANSSLVSNNYTFYGNVDGATNLTVQITPDGTNFYDSQYVYTSSGSGNFGFNVVLSAENVRLKSSNNVNCVCYVNSS